jgi:hypothetical protein
VNVNIQPLAMLVFFVFRKTVFMKSCLSFQVLSAFEISWSHIDWCNFRIHIRSFKLSPLPYLKTPLVEIMIQMKLVGMPMIFRFAKLCLSNCSGLRVVSVKENVNFKFELPTMFILLVSYKSGLNRSCSSSEDIPAYKISWSQIVQ